MTSVRAGTDRLSGWLLRHPSRAGWVLLELFFRPLPPSRRIANAYWQLRWYGRIDKFREVLDQHYREWNALAAVSSSPATTETSET